MGNLTHAIRSAGGPQMKITQSRPIAMLLSIGNRQEEVEGDEGGGGGATTLALQVQYRKATAKAANPRAYKLSMLDVKPDRPPADLYDPHLVQARLGEPKTDTSHYALAHDDAQKGGLQGFELMFADFNSTANRREAVFQRELDKLQQEEAERTMDLDQDESTQSRQAQADTLTHEAARGFSRYIVPPVSSEEATATESEKKKQDPTAAASAVQGSSKDGAQSQQPPPQPELKTLDMNVQTSKAYMYGGTVVPIDSADAELSLQLDLKPGIEVIGFTNKQKVGDMWTIFQQTKLQSLIFVLSLCISLAPQRLDHGRSGLHQRRALFLERSSALFGSLLYTGRKRPLRHRSVHRHDREPSAQSGPPPAALNPDDAISGLRAGSEGSSIDLEATWSLN